MGKEASIRGGGGDMLSDVKDRMIDVFCNLQIVPSSAKSMCTCKRSSSRLFQIEMIPV